MTHLIAKVEAHSLFSTAGHLVPNRRLQPTARWGILSAPRLNRSR